MSTRFSLADWVFAVLAIGVAILLVVRRGVAPDRPDDALAERIARLESDPSTFPAPVRDAIDDLAAAIRALESEVRQLERAPREPAQADPDAARSAARRERPLARDARDVEASSGLPAAGSPEWEAQMREYTEQFLAQRVEDVTVHLELDEEQTAEYRKIVEEEDRLLRDLWARYRPGGSGKTDSTIVAEANRIRRDRDDKLRKLFGDEKFESYKTRYPDPPVDERK